MQKTTTSTLMVTASMCFFLAGCTPQGTINTTPNQPTQQGTIIETTNPQGVIFSKESLKYYPGFPQAEGLWDPTIADATKADGIVKKCLTDKEQVANDMVKLYPQTQQQQGKDFKLGQLKEIDPVYAEYKRQYVGYNGKDGHKLIWINFFLIPDADEVFGNTWKKEIFSVMDGGSAFFDVLVDLDSESCLDFSINGVA